MHSNLLTRQSSSDGLTEAQWETADKIARQLVLDRANLGELKKTIAYLRAYGDRENGGNEFFRYLTTLSKHGDAIGHSSKTQGYYQILEKACTQHLVTHSDDVATMLQILGWAARLMQYYEKSVPIGEIETPKALSKRQAEIQAVTRNQSFTVGQQLEAVVTSKKGIEVLSTGQKA